MENNRYIRQLSLIDYNGKQALQNAKVLCIGAGRLACFVNSFLVAAGVENIGIIDQDIIKLSNLNQQIIYTKQDIGKYKVDILQKYLTKLNSNCKISTYPYNLDSNNTKQLIKSYDFIVDCSDNSITRYIVSDMCNIEHKPLVSSSIDGFSGQIMTFISPQSCYRCLFPQAKNISNFNNGDIIASSIAIIAGIQSNEVIKLITQIKSHDGKQHTSQIINVDSLSNKINTYSITADNDCVNTHQDINYLSSSTSHINHSSSTYIKYSDISNLIDRENHRAVVINMLKYEDEQRLNNSFNSKASVKIISYDNNIQPLANIQKNQQFINVDDNIIIVCSFGAKSKILGQMFCNIGYKHVFYTRYAEIL